MRGAVFVNDNVKWATLDQAAQHDTLALGGDECH